MFRKINRFKRRLQGLALSHGIVLCENDKKLISLKDKHKGKRAFIIGNGPSLNKLDLRLLKNEITIGCNGIFFIFEELGFIPTYYTVEDNLVAEDRADIINKIEGTVKIFPHDLQYCLKGDKNTIFINFQRGNYKDFPKFSESFQSIVYWGGTVTYMNIQLAYYLGIRELYLIGLDHNYTVPKKDDQKGEVITSNSKDLNHFHPDYFGPGYRYHDPKVERMEQGYLEADRFFKKKGGQIYNATMGGHLGVFPRVVYNDLFMQDINQ